MLGSRGGDGSFAAAAVLAAVLILAGCGNDDGGASPPEESRPADEQTTTTVDPDQGGATTTEDATTTTNDEATTTTEDATTTTNDEATTTVPTPVTDPSGPDLQLFTVPECSVVPGGSLSGADSLTIFVAVRNGGPGAVNRLVPVRISSNTGLSATLNTAISTGSSMSAMSVDLSTGDHGRTHVVTIVADPDNQIIERDLSNNALQVTVRLPSRPTQAIDVPCTSP